MLGALLVLLGLFLPRDWYNALPTQQGLPAPPIKGVTLLQFSLVLEGLALIWFSLRRWTFTRLSDAERPRFNSATEPDEADHRPIFFWLLVGITGLAVFLRVLYLDSDLWLDEINTVQGYARRSALEIIGTYRSSNNHLLNTLLTKLSISYFGETEWAVRPPAAFFGAATIPAFYWVSRMALSQWASLSAALLLAVSYHHIFFSQNARGYSAYLLFSLVSSGLLVRGLREDRVSVWAFYVLAMFLNIASLLNGLYVMAGHMIVGAFAVFSVKRHGASASHLLQRLAGVFFLLGFLGFQLYSVALPQIFVVITNTYTSPGSGYNPLSSEFLLELVRGLSMGFGFLGIVGIFVFLIIGSAGFVWLFRRNWALTTALTLPPLITAGHLLFGGMTFSPRFFLLALPLAIMAAVNAFEDLANCVSRIMNKDKLFALRLAGCLTLAVFILSLITLKHYYSTPKQAYRASLGYLESQRKPGDIVFVIHLMDSGYRFYGKRFGIQESKDYFFVRTVEGLDQVLSSHQGQQSFLVTTLPRLLYLHSPELAARISSGWTVHKVFPGTIGDGAITVWKSR